MAGAILKVEMRYQSIEWVINQDNVISYIIDGYVSFAYSHEHRYKSITHPTYSWSVDLQWSCFGCYKLCSSSPAPIIIIIIMPITISVSRAVIFDPCHMMLIIISSDQKSCLTVFMVCHVKSGSVIKELLLSREGGQLKHLHTPAWVSYIWKLKRSADTPAIHRAAQASGYSLNDFIQT